MSIVGTSAAKMDAFSTDSITPLATWRRLPARYVPTGYPVMARVRGSEVLEIGQWSLQDGVIIDIPKDDQKLYRLVASVFIRS